MKEQTHDCPGQCGRQVKRAFVACRGCWHSVPQDLRNQLWKSLKDPLERRENVTYGEALSDVLAWLAEHPGPNPLVK